jgi:DNA-binding GntR family transcriptional regulator
VAVVALGGNRQLSALYASVLVRIQLYMAVNLRREAEVADAADGVHRHERLMAAVERGDADEVLAELSAHGARTYLS